MLTQRGGEPDEPYIHIMQEATCFQQLKSGPAEAAGNHVIFDCHTAARFGCQSHDQLFLERLSPSGIDYGGMYAIFGQLFRCLFRLSNSGSVGKDDTVLLLCLLKCGWAEEFRFANL